MKDLSFLAGAIFLAGLLSACGQSDEEKVIAHAKSDLVRSFKDPDSVQFRNLKTVKGTEGRWIVCGEYNAKNSYGGYVGFDRFLSIVSGRGMEQKAESTYTENDYKKAGVAFANPSGC